MCIRDRPIDHAKENVGWHRLLDVAEIDSMPLHSARHTAASVLLRAGVDPSISMALMGHSSYITTSRYQTTDAKMLARALNKAIEKPAICLLYTSPSPRDRTRSRMPSS